MDDVMAKVGKIDTALNRYYKNLKKPYDKIFLNFCIDNGLADDDDLLMEEIENQDAQESLLADFDDNFPFPTPQNHEFEKRQFMHDLIKKCYDNPDIQFGNLDESIEIAYKLLTKHCGSIFNSQFQNDAFDTAYKMIKSVDIMSQRPILLYFMDSYSRLRMSKYYSTNNKYEISNIDNWDLSKFFHQYKHQIEELIEKTIENKSITVNKLENGLKSFVKRITPKMKLYEPLTLICDNLNHYITYISSITHYITATRRYNYNNNNNEMKINIQNETDNDIYATARLRIETPSHIDI
eukprot:241791_1